MGWTIFVPIDEKEKVNIEQNFYAGICSWRNCGKNFNSWKKAEYCSNSCRAAAGRQRREARVQEQIQSLQKRIKELEEAHDPA